MFNFLEDHKKKEGTISYFNEFKTTILLNPTSSPKFQKVLSSKQGSIIYTPSLNGCDLDDFKDTSKNSKIEIYSFFEEYQEKLAGKKFVKLSDYQLPLNEKPNEDSYFSSGFFPQNENSNVFCSKCKYEKNSWKDMVKREEDGYFQGCLQWTMLWDERKKQKICLELMDNKGIQQ